MISVHPSGVLVARFPGGFVAFGRTKEELEASVARWWRKEPAHEVDHSA